MRFENRVALVTGAGSGIGKAVAMFFLLSDAASDVNVANLPVDGGWTAFGSYGDAGFAWGTP